MDTAVLVAIVGGVATIGTAVVAGAYQIKASRAAKAEKRPPPQPPFSPPTVQLPGQPGGPASNYTLAGPEIRVENSVPPAHDSGPQTQSASPDTSKLPYVKPPNRYGDLHGDAVEAQFLAEVELSIRPGDKFRFRKQK